MTLSEPGRKLLPEDELVALAKAGEAAAFEYLVAPHRLGLGSHCYRMLAAVREFTHRANA